MYLFEAHCINGRNPNNVIPSQKFASIRSERPDNPIIFNIFGNFCKIGPCVQTISFGVAMIIVSFILFMKLDRYVWKTAHEI